MSADDPELTIIIVTWNSEAEIAACLSALGSPPASWSVVVFDNASSDRTVAVVRERFPWASVIPSETNRGFAAGCNAALAGADSDFFLLLNPDTECAPAAVRAAVGALRARPRAGGLGVRLLDAAGRLQPSCFRFPTPWLNLLQLSGAYRLLPRKARAEALLGSNWAHDEARPVDWLLGAFLLVRREAVERVGPMSEDYFLFAEDIDWCWRFAAAGFEVWFTPEAAVRHHGGRSTDRLGHERCARLAVASKYRFCAYRLGAAAARLVQLTDLVCFAARRAASFADGRSAHGAWAGAGFAEAARGLTRPLPRRAARP